MEHHSRPTIPLGYAEHAPPADLAAHVECFWTRVVRPGAGEQSRQRILPDGCVDIIVPFGERATQALAVGTMTRPLIVTEREPEVYIGVRFRPGRALAAFGVPAAELTDESVAYEMVARDGRAALDVVVAQPTNEARLQSLIEFVRSRVAAVEPIPTSVRHAVRTISGAHGNLRVAELATSIGITRQQLARLFATHVGVSPKTFARVMRARAALARADAARAAHPREVDWSAIAYELGYYDQPHFIDDFKTITGSTPGQWLANSTA